MLWYKFEKVKVILNVYKIFFVRKKYLNFIFINNVYEFIYCN